MEKSEESGKGMFRKPNRKGKKIIENLGPEEEDEEFVMPVYLPQKRNHGICASKLLDFVEPAIEPVNPLSVRFVKQKSQLEAIKEVEIKQRVKNVLSTLEKKTNSDEKIEEFNFEIPEKYKVDNKRIEEGPTKSIWQAGIIEVPLSIEHKLDNIEATEAAKRRVIRGDINFASRFDEIHKEEYEQFNENLHKARNHEKEMQRLEKKMVLRGKRYKLDKEKRVKENEAYEKLCQNLVNNEKSL
jgi:hypothetical protein